MLKIARFLKAYKKQVILGPIFKLIEAIFELIVPIIMAKIIDIGIQNKDISYVLKMGILLVLIGIVGLCSSLICQRYAAIASQGFGTTVRNELFSHINTFSYKEIDKFGTPSLITRIINDVNQLQFAVAMLIRLVIRAPFLAMGAIIMAIILDFKLSLIFLIATPIIVAILYFVMSKSIPYFRSIQKKLDKISLITRENLEGVRVVRAFSNQNYEETRFKDASDDLSNTAIKVGKLSSLLNPLTYIVLNFSIIAIIWFGGIRVDAGNLTQGQIIAFVNYMTQILLALIVVSNLVVVFTKASASAARVNEVFETSSSIIGNNNKLTLDLKSDAYKEALDLNQKNKINLNTQTLGLSSIRNNPAKIEFKNVSFSYGASEKYIPNIGSNSIASDEYINKQTNSLVSEANSGPLPKPANQESHASQVSLNNISFKIYENETIGIIGGTGSGKSTLVNLISRFYDPSNGEIFINEHNLKEYPLYKIRHKIGLVPQASVLFTGTIAENIKIGNPDATNEDIKRVLEISESAEFVAKLSKTYETHLDQGGKNLSGGQKQRLTIARALAINPEILILDDSFSALDFATDARLRSSLKNKLPKNTTVIIVSQRIATIKNADKILVLDDGSLVGIGTHDELMKNCDVYNEIYFSQNQESEEREVN
ncbi:putative ABC transporter ATP-binding protein [Clostridium puniceum]|uniref:Putative ABC transporter ATP-binding protein n=1 Tax=Clostridium puniceum TaxID=29367 RepID=A0A1S8TEH8_9CLOT|nr:ABC transporter ATP-binding protein [Clostridium puniceum]OOM76042.1 putative ABC transporter ATP-binding protein [Clostridium puniceum]